jgi:GT2 family glycosyltransferase
MTLENIQPLVSIVILSWNRKDDVRESLSRIYESDYPNIEVIVSDNGSMDGTPDMVRNNFPQALLLRSNKNIGIEAYNAGFKAAKGEFIVILDDDSFPEKSAVARMVKRFQENPDLGIVAFDVRNYHSYDQVASDINEDDSATAESYLMGFNGAGAGVRKAVFERAGYYPGEFFLYWNEQDFSLRVLDAGYAIKFFPDIVSYHKYSPANRDSLRAPFYYCRNAFWLVWKNYQLTQALLLTFSLCRRIAYHSLEQKTTVYFKAMFSAMRGIALIARLRKPVRKEITAAFRAPLELSFTYYR